MSTLCVLIVLALRRLKWWKDETADATVLAARLERFSQRTTTGELWMIKLVFDGKDYFSEWKPDVSTAEKQAIQAFRVHPDTKDWWDRFPQSSNMKRRMQILPCNDSKKAKTRAGSKQVSTTSSQSDAGHWKML